MFVLRDMQTRILRFSTYVRRQQSARSKPLDAIQWMLDYISFSKRILTHKNAKMIYDFVTAFHTCSIYRLRLSFTQYSTLGPNETLMMLCMHKYEWKFKKNSISTIISWTCSKRMRENPCVKCQMKFKLAFNLISAKNNYNMNEVKTDNYIP